MGEPPAEMSRRTFLKTVGAGLGALAVKRGRGPQTGTSLRPVSGEYLDSDPGREFLFSVEEATRVGEPAVAVAEGKLFVVAMADNVAGNKNLPLQVWVADINNPSKIDHKEIKIAGYTSGSDPVIQYLPEAHKVVVFFLATKAGLLLTPETKLVKSVYDLKTDTWLEGDKLDFDKNVPVNVDKPWFVWRNGRGWLTFVQALGDGTTRVGLYFCGTDLKFSQETFTPLDRYHREFPMAFPVPNGKVHLIFRRTRAQLGESADITEMIYDPNSKQLLEEQTVVGGVPNSSRERQLEHKWISTTNLNGLVTPQGGIIITVPDKDGVALGYLGFGETSWQIEKLVPSRLPREHLGISGFANPFMAGQDTVGVQYFADIYSTTSDTPTRYIQTFLLREQNGTLIESKTATGYTGISYRSEPMDRNAEVGDYIEVQSDTSSNGGVPIVNMEGNAIRVRLYPPVPMTSSPMRGRP